MVCVCAVSLHESVRSDVASLILRCRLFLSTTGFRASVQTVKPWQFDSDSLLASHYQCEHKLRKCGMLVFRCARVSQCSSGRAECVACLHIRVSACLCMCVLTTVETDGGNKCEWSVSCGAMLCCACLRLISAHSQQTNMQMEVSDGMCDVMKQEVEGKRDEVRKKRKMRDMRQMRHVRE